MGSNGIRVDPRLKPVLKDHRRRGGRGPLHWYSGQWIFWGHWPEVFGTAARSAEALGDPLLEATQLDYYAWAALLCQGRPRDSFQYSARALAAARLAGDPVQEAWAHQYAGWAHCFLGEGTLSSDHDKRAIALFHVAGDPHGTLQALLQRAYDLQKAGLNEEALGACQETLDQLEEAGDRVEPHIAEFTRGSA
ncbi:hypothetical protein ABZ079_33945 [Streptomyces sp. NPDC006314]|uniref:hypothetical protein n=1 Tax=Streptomyces sp. NPDC006314 TaxID=3154475 RepID=UPI00339E25DF